MHATMTTKWRTERRVTVSAARSEGLLREVAGEARGEARGK